MSLSTHIVPSYSSSSSSTPPSTYEVFLSFRGEDTRNGFTDHLHAALKHRGLVVFRDDEKLQPGKVFSQELMTAIHQSQFAIVVISKNFSFSTWCLRELTEILECMREGRLTVLPVFYHVEPSDVRKQKRSFGKAFNKHKENPEINIRQKKSRRTDLKEVVDCATEPFVKRKQDMHFVEASTPNAGNLEFDEDLVKSWRSALKEVGNLSGWHVDNSSEATVVEQITAKVFYELRVNSSKTFKNLVGMDSKVEQLVSLLHLEMDDVRYIGIHGMGGVGKTTLAKVLYESICCKFEAHCIIFGTENNQSRSVVELQREIIHKILKEPNPIVWNQYEGTKLIANRLCSKNVLIVFDDINREQLDALAGSPTWFGRKSRIVITGRDCQIWKPLVSDYNTYEVKLLNEKDALQLFCWKAFDRPRPDVNFEELSVKIMRHAGGLPLAIKVIGSSLVGAGMEVWNDICDYLEANPNAEVMDKLEISYIGLEDLPKKIFLDIACFYNGRNAHSIIPIWKSLDCYPEICIDILRHKSLLDFSHSQQFQMHDLVQKMGQRIVYQESPSEPGKRSRLFYFKDIVRALKNEFDTNLVEGIVLKFAPGKEEQLSCEGFSKFTSLKILMIEPKFEDCLLEKGITWSGCPSKLMLSKEIRLLKWHGYPFSSLPRSFQLDNLVALQMPYSNIKQLWHGWIPNFEKLTSIDFSNSEDLRETPDFGGSLNLEKISFQLCRSLWKVHPSIGNLKRLVHLNLMFCHRLKKLPKVINWESLKHLRLGYCFKLEKLPDLSKAPNVEEICLCCCISLWKVHPSLGNLNRLVTLDLTYCKSLKKLPKEINWKSLKRLELRRCSRLEKLPDLSKVPNVEEIGLFGCESLWKVHPSFGNLKRLVDLDLSFCKSLKKLPKKINWISLLRLKLPGCSRLLESEKSTKVVSNIISLPLDLSGTAIKMSPLSSQTLSSPRKLAVGGFKRTKLAVGGFKRTKTIQSPQDMLRGSTGFYLGNDSNLSCFLVPNWLANFSFLKELNLEDLNLSDESFPKDFSLPTVESLYLSGNRFTRIPEFLSQLSKLSSVRLSRCKYIQSVAFTAFPGGVRSIDLSDCNLFDGAIYDDLGSLSHCRKFILNKNEFTTLTDSLCLLSNLRFLGLRECRRLQALPKLPLSLHNLDVFGSPLLEMIYDQTDTETSWKALNTCVLVVWFSIATINGYDATPYKIIQLQPSCPINKVEYEHLGAEVSWGPTMRFEIPEWFQQRSTGLFGEFKSSADEDLEDWFGYALFVVYEVHECGFPEFVCQFHLNDISREQPLVLRVPEACYIGANGFWAFVPWHFFAKESMNLLGRYPRCFFPPSSIKWKVEIKVCGVSITSNSSNVEIKKCGMRVIHRSDVSEFFDVLGSISPHGLKLKTLDELHFHFNGHVISQSKILQKSSSMKSGKQIDMLKLWRATSTLTWPDVRSHNPCR